MPDRRSSARLGPHQGQIRGHAIGQGQGEEYPTIQPAPGGSDVPDNHLPYFNMHMRTYRSSSGGRFFGCLRYKKSLRHNSANSACILLSQLSTHFS